MIGEKFLTSCRNFLETLPYPTLQSTIGFINRVRREKPLKTDPTQGANRPLLWTETLSL